MKQLCFSNTFLKRTIFTYLLFTVVLTHPLLSQNDLDNSPGSWLVFSGNHHIGEHWKIPTVGILTYYNLAEQTEFGFFRTGITYAPNSKNNYTLGLAYLDTQPFDHNEFETLTTQQWIYEEFCHNSDFYNSNVSQRLRLEQRWITKPTEHFFNTRFRYRLQFKKSISKNLYLKTFDEAFFDLKEANVNQNRFFMGLGRNVAPNINIEIGYMKSHVGKNNFDRIRMVMVFSTKLYKRSKDSFTKNDELNNSQ